MSKARSKNKTQELMTAEMNNVTFRHYYDRLLELSISMFEWVNLPKTIDSRFLELTLFEKGTAIFFNDDVLGYLALKCALHGKFNVYGIPINRRAYAVNGYNNEFTDKDSVIIYNNLIHTNSMESVYMYAKRLYNLDRAIDINGNAQKTPIIIECEESQRLTMVNLYKDYDGNEPVIYYNKGMSNKPLTVLKTDAPYVADKLYQLKTQIWNEALTYLGISNTNVTKKERMISDEVIRNQGGVIASRHSRLESRRQACQMINDMFGLDIDVNYREDYREVDDELMLTGATEESEAKAMVTDLSTKTQI